MQSSFELKEETFIYQEEILYCKKEPVPVVRHWNRFKFFPVWNKFVPPILDG